MRALVLALQKLVFPVLILLVVQLGLVSLCKASEVSQAYESGKSLAEKLSPVSPSQDSLSTIPNYKGENVSEVDYKENFHKMSETASKLTSQGDENSEDPSFLAGHLLRESANTKSYKVDSTDSLLTEGDKIVADPLSVMEGELTSTSSDTEVEKSTHTCEEPGDSYLFTCKRELVIIDTIKKSRKYLYTHRTGWSYQNINETFQDEFTPEVCYSHFDGCNYWHCRDTKYYEYSKSLGENSPTKITKEEYDSSTLKPEDTLETWTSTCGLIEDKVDQGLCSYVTKKATKGRETRVINGFSITRSCWEETLTYECSSPYTSTCENLKAKNCSQVGSKCIEKIGDTCVLYEQTYECVEIKKDLKKVTFKGSVPYCLDGNCASQSYTSNPDMAEALSKLMIFKEIQKDMDVKGQGVFKGETYGCDRNCVDFRDCCSSGKGWGVSLGLAGCSEKEKALAKLRSERKCVLVGTYCTEKVLGICLRKRTNFCCFGTKLAKILHEQGRSQLGIGWGEAESANCRAFTIDELQKIDFHKIDLSELYADLLKGGKTPDMTKITDEMKDNWTTKTKQIRERITKEKNSEENKSKENEEEGENNVVL